MSAITKIKSRNCVLYRALSHIRRWYIFLREYLSDISDCASFSMSAARSKGDFDYQITMLTHFIEKGMCYKNLRPFGHRHIIELMKLLTKYNRDKLDGFVFRNAISLLCSWVEFFESHGWQDEPLLSEVRHFTKPYLGNLMETGFKLFVNPGIHNHLDNESILLTRCSVRDYKRKEIDKDDLEFPLHCFIKAPSACNRQMCKVYQICDEGLISQLHSTVKGIGGLNLDALHYFIVTFDLAAISGSTERNQGYLNAGLSAMNFVNGLHANGIGSCFMEWNIRRSEDVKIRKAMKLPESERIAVVIGAGYYLDETVIPCSPRKSIEDIYKII